MCPVTSLPNNSSKSTGRKTLPDPAGHPGLSIPHQPRITAGLTCEDGVSSRLVMEKNGAYPWQVKFGPLTEKDFKKLPETHWTLLLYDSWLSISDLFNISSCTIITETLKKQ
jgi:hypothetical protein